MVYNHKDKVLNLANIQACSYKHNKDIFLLNPESPKKETAHEFRKQEMGLIFNRIKNFDSKVNSKLNSGRINVESNLTPAELRGLKSLKKWIKSGELLVVDTDKSKKFAVMSQKQYFEAGLSHANKDLEIEHHQVKKLESIW